MLSKMLKSALIGSMFITLSYAGNLSIEDREDVVRVSNNVHFFVFFIKKDISTKNWTNSN